MNRPHLLTVTGAPGDYAALFEAAANLGLRLGWLELGGATGDIEAPLPTLEAAAAAGALRAVAVGERRTLVVKPRRGPAVLDDLLREHFRGCALVLMQADGTGGGGTGYPELIAGPSGFEVAGRRFTAESLAAALRRIRPFEG